MTRQSGDSVAGRLVSVVLLGGFLFALAASLPGHMSTDSVVQLLEGRTGVYTSFNPRVVSWLLGLFDAILPGTALFVVCDAGLLFASLFWMKRLGDRVTWLAVAVALLVVLSPLVMIYQTIVWKDVLFANLAVAGFVALAFAVKWWPDARRRALPLILALIALSLATVTRQNGALILVPAGLAVVVASGRDKLWRRLAWGAVVMVAPLLMGQGLQEAVIRTHEVRADAFDRGVRLLLHYDIIGAAAHEPGLPMPALEARSPAMAENLRKAAADRYTPQRIDTLAHIPSLKGLWDIDAGVIQAEWRDVVIHHTGAYLAHRLEVYRWTMAPPDVRLCLPIHIGVDGPADRLAALGLTAGQDTVDNQLWNYTTWFIYSPVFAHATYALIAMVVSGILLFRRRPTDLAMIGLMAAALMFAGSFFFISLACDYRYLYFLDLAAMVGLFYLALDPPASGRSVRWRPN